MKLEEKKHIHPAYQLCLFYRDCPDRIHFQLSHAPVSVKRRIWVLIAVIAGGFVVYIILQDDLASSQ